MKTIEELTCEWENEVKQHADIQALGIWRNVFKNWLRKEINEILNEAMERVEHLEGPKESENKLLGKAIDAIQEMRPAKTQFGFQMKTPSSATAEPANAEADLARSNGMNRDSGTEVHNNKIISNK